MQLHPIMIASPCMFYRWERPSGSDEAVYELHSPVMKWTASSEGSGLDDRVLSIILPEQSDDVSQSFLHRWHFSADRFHIIREGHFMKAQSIVLPYSQIGLLSDEKDVVSMFMVPSQDHQLNSVLS